MGHGGNVEEIARIYNFNEKNIVDFSANINPLGLSKVVKEEMIKAIDKVERYPDITYYDLKNSIALYENIEAENIILGNGAAEVIFNIARGIKPKNALLIAPTFIEYEDALRSIDCNVNHYILNNEFNIDNNFINMINKDIDILFICNPNNPTGVLTSKEFIIKVVEKAKTCETTVIIDESFLDFLENKQDYSVIDLVKEYDNLIVLKSLTKFFAFPGIRIGYGITNNKDYISKINKVSVSWGVNTVATFGAIAAVKEKGYIKESIEYIKREKDFLYKELETFEKLKVYYPSVNFIFFKYLDKHDLKEKLLQKGILIRDCSNYIGLKSGFYRVAVRTREENERLIDVLRKVL